ncbi:MAG: ribosomal protection-like ABC-F family protein [Leptospirales bacterium]
MNLLSIHEAGKEIADKLLFKEISMGVDDQDKIAIIGVNGSGKTTLLKILAGLDQFDDGKYAKNKSLVCGYLQQDVEFEENQSIQEFIFASDNQRMKVLRDHLLLTIKMEDLADDQHESKEAVELQNRLEKLQDQMNELDVWQLESDAKEILFHLNIHGMATLMSDLSGGMVRKVALARLFIEDNNLLLLDEPTNHLDLASIAWLETYLIKIKKAMIIITHDRYFLDNITNHILEIDNLKINKFKGNYSNFLERKAEIAVIEQRTLAKHNNILTRELEWLSRMPKARGTKQKARIQAIEERVEVVASKKPKTKMGGFYSGADRLGKKIMEIVNITKSFPAKGPGKSKIKTESVTDEKKQELIFPVFSYEFHKKERIAIIGDNGAGKTTFLKILMQEVEPDAGKVSHGVNTKIGYLAQVNAPIDENLTVVHAVREIANYIEFEDGKKITATQLLDRFLFTGSKHGQKVSRLSGGERRRLEIIRILMTNPNFLILDEPTNDLDLQTLSLFEEYLLEFPGCLIVVSHDRYFLDKLADTLLVFEKGEPIQKINGICSDYLYQKNNRTSKSKNSPSLENQSNANESYASTEAKKKPGNNKVKLSYKQERRKTEIEKEIPQLEGRLKELDAKLNSGESDAQKLDEWYKEHSLKENLLLELMGELENFS